METPKIEIEITEDVIFALCYGVRIAVESHAGAGALDDPDVINPILERMRAVLGSSRRSLVQAHDDNMDEIRHARALETELCGGYLEMVEDEQ